MGRQKKTKKTIQKREPAVLRVNYVDPKNYTDEEIEDKPHHFNNIIFNEVVEAIENTIHYPQNKIELFEIKSHCVFITVEKQYFPEILYNAMQYFEEMENYEMCSKCQNLLLIIKI